MKTLSYPPDYLSETLSLLLKHFQICQNDVIFSIEPIQNFEELAQKLQNFIKKLLCEDFQRLVNALYLIDVGEEKFHEAMQSPDIEVVAKQISLLVIKREVQKVYFRKNLLNN